jgi:hypothetical protein
MSLATYTSHWEDGQTLIRPSSPIVEPSDDEEPVRITFGIPLLAESHLELSRFLFEYAFWSVYSAKLWGYQTLQPGRQVIVRIYEARLDLLVPFTKWTIRRSFSQSPSHIVTLQRHGLFWIVMNPDIEQDVRLDRMALELYKQHGHPNFGLVQESNDSSAIDITDITISLPRSTVSDLALDGEALGTSASEARTRRDRGKAKMESKTESCSPSESSTASRSGQTGYMIDSRSRGIEGPRSKAHRCGIDVLCGSNFRSCR